jgi:hypothetical protein
MSFGSQLSLNRRTSVTTHEDKHLTPIFIGLIFIGQLTAHSKGKGLPQQAEVAQGDPGRLRPRIFLAFGTTRVVGRQPYAPAAFTQGEILGTHF